MTLPITTSSTSAAGTRARSSAARIAIAPSSGAASDDRAPRYFPIGVRAAPTITGVRESVVIARRKLDEVPGEWETSRTLRVNGPRPRAPLSFEREEEPSGPAKPQAVGRRLSYQSAAA